MTEILENNSSLPVTMSIMEMPEGKSEFFINDFQKEVWEDTYQFEDETIEGTMLRLVNSLYAGEPEALKKQLYDALINRRISFGGRVVANTGTGMEKVNSFNCYAAQRAVKPVDSIKNIYTDLHNAAEILKTEGGIGYDFSHLRPCGTMVKGIRSASPGVVEFMTLYDKSSEIITKSSVGEIYQDGGEFIKRKIRKGAQIAMLRIEHPDIIEFIEAKSIPNRLTKFNISVSITDAFMDAVINGEKWDLWFPDIRHPEYDKEWDGDFDKWVKKYPEAKVVYKTMAAKKLWELILKNSYTTNDPGIFFIDNANHYNNISYYQRIVNTNPCGEITMASDPGNAYFDRNDKLIGNEDDINEWVKDSNNVYEYVSKIEHLGDICNLGHLNLVSYYTLENGFNFKLFKDDVRLLTRALDNLIDMSKYPLLTLEHSAKLRRKLGMGFLGYGSLLFMMRLRYGSEEANEFTREMMETYALTAYEASALLASERGHFPLFTEQYHESGFMKNSGVISPWVQQLINEHGTRNAFLLTVAPTGNTGIFMGLVSGGEEPVFDREYYRWRIVSHRIKSVPELKTMEYPKFWKGEWHETDDFYFDFEGDEQILVSKDNNFKIDKNRGMVQKIICEDYGWKWVKEHFSEDKITTWKDEGIFATAMELSVEEHLEPFKIISHHVDQSVSKTVNISSNYPFKHFNDMFIDLWKSGARGITTYREGSRTAVLESIKEEDTAKQQQDNFYETWHEHKNGVIEDNVKLPIEYPMMGHIVRSEGKKWYFHVAFKDRFMAEPFALFVQTNHSESEINTMNAVELLTDLAYKSKIPEHLILENIEKLKSKNNINKITRTAGFLLRHNVKIDKIVVELDKVDVSVVSFVFTLKKFLTRYVKSGTISTIQCSSCNGTVIFESGCLVCRDCGYSVC